MAAWMESVCACGVHEYMHKRGSERQLAGIHEEREGKRVSAFVNIPPRVPHFLGIGLAGSLSPASITLLQKHLHAFRGSLFSLNPDCVNTTACKHNDDL